MRDIADLLERQRHWQEGLRDLSWAEKVRMAERICESALALRASGAKRPQAPAPKPPNR